MCVSTSATYVYCNVEIQVHNLVKRYSIIDDYMGKAYALQIYEPQHHRANHYDLIRCVIIDYADAFILYDL